MVNLYKYQQELIENKANSLIFLPIAHLSSIIAHMPGGEIGRHRGFKIPAHKACRFESGPGHHFQILNLVLQRIQRMLVFMPKQNEFYDKNIITRLHYPFITKVYATDLFSGTLSFKDNHWYFSRCYITKDDYLVKAPEQIIDKFKTLEQKEKLIGSVC